MAFDESKMGWLCAKVLGLGGDLRWCCCWCQVKRIVIGTKGRANTVVKMMESEVKSGRSEARGNWRTGEANTEESEHKTHF